MTKIAVPLYRYCIEMYKSQKIGKIFNYWLAESKDFFLTKKLKDTSYWKNNKFIRIYKY